MLFFVLVVGVMMFISGNVFDKIGVKFFVIFGFIILVISFYELVNVISMDLSKLYIIFIICMRLVGLGIVMMLISIVGMNVVEIKLVGRVLVFNNIIR